MALANFTRVAVSLRRGRKSGYALSKNISQ